MLNLILFLTFYEFIEFFMNFSMNFWKKNYGIKYQTVFTFDLYIM